ncbi:MAG: DegQ family serine endoprotease [Desulfobacterales bacterium]|nr:DegQ family serine endoprotease [Desulfobacterales bacterium]MDX2511111.1 DegQ family serine endoprotease [Desulfobacterales bacterium]
MIIKYNIYKSIMVAVLVGMLAGFVPAVSATAQETGVVMVPNNFSQLAKDAKPSVVNIRTVTTVKGGGRVFNHFFGGPPNGRKNPFEEFGGPFQDNQPQRDFKQRSLGSGFIIDKEGYIVTNNHVVENADQIKVKLADEKEFDAELVGRDPKTDLALIKISTTTELSPIKMGNSDMANVGNWVVAIGSPFGLEQTVTAGIVSAKGRIIGFGPYEDFIQTDASINPGNSGGPLINMQGEVVGINTAIVASAQGIGFAIPINMAKDIVAQLKSTGEVTRGWLGVGIQDLSTELKQYYGVESSGGVLITQVFEGDPAAKGGIKPNDIVVEISGQTVTSARELSSIIANTEIGKKTTIKLLRNGKRKTVQVELAKRDDDKLTAKGPGEESNDDIGIQLMDLSDENAGRFGFEADEKGVLVIGIKPGGKAESAGIRRGDLVKEVNHEQVLSVQEYTKQVNKIDEGDEVQFLIRRAREGFVVVTFTK